MKVTPPGWILSFLRKICRHDLYEMIEGDLMEEFEDNVESLGLRKARRRFILSAIKFIHPKIIKSGQSSLNLNYHNMLSHYLISSIRQITRNKTLSSINIIGLAVGICAFFLISEYVSYETSFDTFHENKDDIYRVAYQREENGELKIASARNLIGISKLVEQNVQEVTAVTAFDRSSQSATFQFLYNGKDYYQPGSFYQADDSFFKVFPSLLAKGDPTSALLDPHNLVLSQKMATLIFGDDDPIGKKIDNRSYSFSDVGSFVVTGVMIDAPETSHLHIDFIAKDSNDEAAYAGDLWTDPRFYTYLTLAPGADPDKVAEKLNFLLKSLSTEHAKTANVTVKLQAITDIHNSSNLAEELEPNGNKILLYLLSAVGIGILICAWVNYVNIETARFIARTKEVGVRKVLGSDNRTLVVQFFTEYLTGAGISIVVAVLMMLFISSSYHEMLNLRDFKYWHSPIWVGSCIVFITGLLLTGVVLAIIFSKRKNGLAINTRISPTRYSTPFRRGLVTFQFTCSISLIAILMIVRDQTIFMMSTNKGIDVNNIVSIRNPTVYTNDDSISMVEYNAFKHELITNTMISNATGSSAIPGMEVEVSFINRLKRNQGDPYDPTPYKVLFVDYDYTRLYDLKLKAGRNYSSDYGDEKTWSTVILNETAVRKLGFNNPIEAIDTEVFFQLFGDSFKRYTIIGVVEDYYHETAKNSIQPTILALNHGVFNGVPISFQQVFFSVKLNPETNPHEGLAFIEQTWKQLFPNKPFDFFFQDEYYDRQFKTERKFGTVFGMFTGVSVLIACLGIVGMTLFETRSRAKEVSVRKILGATVTNLVGLLSIGYVRLIAISSIICVPIILFTSSSWLSNYPIRINITPGFFITPILTLIAIVAISSGVQTIKTAIANPVDQLNRE